MSYYTERHGLRSTVEKTYTISVDMYNLLFDCCQGYYKYLDHMFSPDGYFYLTRDYQFDEEKFNYHLKLEIPNLYRDGTGQIAKPKCIGSYDQFALLDFIEFIANNIKDNNKVCKIFKKFQTDINKVFSKMGLLYQLTNRKIIERIVENSPITKEIEKNITTIKENGLRELLQKSILLYRSPEPAAHKEAVEKIWDALERLKTYYTDLDKKGSADKIVFDMSNGVKEYQELFSKEFYALTQIGNTFRIRHHETYIIELSNEKYYDYFFNRCLSLIALAVQFLH